VTGCVCDCVIGVESILEVHFLLTKGEVCSFADFFRPAYAMH
jgi:hypothetical protein